MLDIKQSIMNLGTKKRIIFGILLIIALELVILSGQFLYYTVAYGQIYKEVYIGDVNVGGLSKEAAIKLLNEKYNYTPSRWDNLKITISIGDIIKELTFNQLNIKYDVKASVDNAYKVGRTGNILNRAYGIFSFCSRSERLMPEFTIDKSVLDNAIQSIHEQIPYSVQQPSFAINGSKVTIYSGRDGNAVDKDKLYKEINNAISECASRNITLQIKAVKHDKIVLDDFYNDISAKPQDAKYIRSGNKIDIVPEKYGYVVDKGQLRKAVDELNNQNDTYLSLNVQIIEPKIKTDDLNGKLLKDVLSMYGTQFYTNTASSKNRATNIKISTAAINGYILNPGDEFSFNKVVGQRTTSKGYVVAHAYSNGQIVDAVGGGICQVSSTLYDAAVLADLQIVERHSHMFTVGYIPYGRDATVSYGSVDLRFKNNTNWPIQIVGTVSSNNRVTFTIKGTSEVPNKIVKIETTILETNNYGVKYIDDPSLEEGKKVVVQAGMKGYVVDAFKVITINGEQVSRTKLNRSVYRPLDEEVRRGTKKIQSAPPAQSGTQVQPESQSPSDQQPPQSQLPSEQPPST